MSAWERGYLATLVIWFLCGLFVWAVRVGPISDAAWSEDCKTLASGGAVVPMAAQHDYLRACP